MQTSLFPQTQPLRFAATSPPVTSQTQAPSVMAPMAEDRLELRAVRFGNEKPAVDVDKLKTDLRLSYQPEVQARQILEILRQKDNGLSMENRIDLLVAVLERSSRLISQKPFYTLLTAPIYTENPDMAELNYLAKKVSKTSYRMDGTSTTLLLAHRNNDPQTVRDILVSVYADDRNEVYLKGLLDKGVSPDIRHDLLRVMAKKGQVKTVQHLLETDGIPQKVIHKALREAVEQACRESSPQRHVEVVQALLATGQVDKSELNEALLDARSDRRYSKPVIQLLKAHRQANYPTLGDKLALKLRESRQKPDADKKEQE